MTHRWIDQDTALAECTACDGWKCDLCDWTGYADPKAAADWQKWMEQDGVLIGAMR